LPLPHESVCPASATPASSNWTSGSLENAFVSFRRLKECKV
jgi:hypothetical protein